MVIKNKSNIINPFSYWAIDRSIAAGEYPGRQVSFNILVTLATLVHSIRAIILERRLFLNSSSYKIGSLLDNGIRTFVDLTEEGERPDYRNVLLKERRKRSLECRYFRFPIQDKQVPTKSHMAAIIDLVKSEVESGRPVYIHCFRGIGRTGLAVGCLLQEYGLSGEDPINVIGEIRRGQAGDFRTSPETVNQRKFVVDWFS